MFLNTTKTGDAKMPSQEPTPIFIDVTRAADILNISGAAVRQLIQRGKIIVHRTGQGRIQLDLSDVLTYHAKRLNMPSWELNCQKLRGQVFVSTSKASERLNVAESYVISLLKKKKLEGYVLSDGTIYVSEATINAHLGVPSSDTNDL